MYPLSGPLNLDVVQTPLGGRIAMTHCPGRNTIDGKGRQWERVLSADLAAIQAEKISTVISLIAPEEMEKLGVPELPQALSDIQLNWLHFPIEDFGVPSAQTLRTWHTLLPSILARLTNKETILIHCAAGLGSKNFKIVPLSCLLKSYCQKDQKVARPQPRHHRSNSRNGNRINVAIPA